MNVLRVEGLGFSYGEDILALDNVTVEIKKGKTTGFLGGNGAGKSTLFLNLNGVLKSNIGEIYIEDKKVNRDKEGIKNLRKQVGIVFQDPNDQLFSASVRNDIAFGIQNKGLSKAEMNQRVEAIALKLGIFEILDKPTHSLSFGQKKRVAIAGVLIMEPSVIILDEPTAGLDPQGVVDILSLLEDLKKDKNIAIVISTHEIDIVPIYCDYVYVMDKGKIVLQGETNEVFNDPEAIRRHHLRLPRINHLMEVLVEKDNLNLDKRAGTISKARKSILSMVKSYEGNI